MRNRIHRKRGNRRWLCVNRQRAVEKEDQEQEKKQDQEDKQKTQCVITLGEEKDNERIMAAPERNVAGACECARKTRKRKKKRRK